MVGVCLLLVYVFVILLVSTSTDCFRAIQLLKDSESMVSGNGDFKLGFFSPPNSTSRYLGIWFNKPSIRDYVWVANRNNPLTDSSGVLRISEDGNLQVLNGKNDTLWKTNLPQPLLNASRNVNLSDNGNFVLQEFGSDGTKSTNGTPIWQTFGHPTDSIIAGMRVSLTGSNVTTMLRCWKSPSDPSYGRFTLGLDSTTRPQTVIWDGDQIRWRSGPWNGNIFLGLIYSDPTNNYADTYVQQNELEGTVTFVYTGARSLTFSHYAFSYDGALNEVWWDSGKGSWQTVYKAPDIDCDFYGKCGVFGTCNPLKSPICRCLKGYRPKSVKEYSRGNWSGGCVRRTPLGCGTPRSQEDGFLVFKKVKLPDLEEWKQARNPADCRGQCLKNCSCLAYGYDAGVGCMHWSKDLIDIQEYTGSGIDLYLRVAHSELKDKRKQKVVIAAVVVSVTVSIVLLIIFFWWLLKRLKAKEARRKNILETHKYRDDRSQTNMEELPHFELEILADATENFHESHKLGQGGFGQVYKGRLKDGQEIAVKRLSATSGQGLEEFTNEVQLISKLQHKNLVSLVGFCVEGEEKLLVYEYMPNKSLDLYLFDPTKGEILDWTTRFGIIEGICRGLIYLHRDSRLRIIHRDLKASNVLLDKDYNPKISDFGMARIFGHGQDLEKTRRVVGTYGYMSPEYAMEGHFSEKSDVFSFGVLLLEILSGKRNNSFWFEEESLTLLGYAWKLWVEGDVSSIIDPFISDPVFRKEIERSIQVGLLCVQEYAKDRPGMSTVMSMLASDIADLPRPKQPGFNRRQIHLDTSSSQLQSSNADDVSFTSVSGR